MSLKSKVFAFLMVFSLGVVGADPSAFASGIEREAPRSGFSKFVKGAKSFFKGCFACVRETGAVIDEVLDEADERLEQFQGYVEKFQRRVNAFVVIADLQENKNVVIIQEGLELIHGNMGLVRSLIGAADDIVEDARDGISIQDLMRTTARIRGAMRELKGAKLLKTSHIKSVNGRLDSVDDRLGTLNDFLNMGRFLDRGYRGFATVDGTFDLQERSRSSSKFVDEDLDL
ncbi:MAG: hypothetical protein GY915_04980 [bacterium]|nr:hypothetical protein [bacterium]